MNKKLLCVLLTAIMVLSMNMVVKAAELNSNGDSVEVPVKYTVDNTEFIIRIPAEITPDVSDMEFEITANKMNLRPDESVFVSISEGCDENGQVIMTRQGDRGDNPATLTTTLMVNNAVVSDSNSVVGMFRDGDNSTDNLMGKVKMSGVLIDENTKAGDYIGTLEFKVELRKD